MLVAWCASATYALVTREADRAFPDETGGVFMGYWVRPRFEVIVTDVVGPGPEAVHEPKRFVPDSAYQEREIAAIYADSGRRRTYLGDWHTHPKASSGRLSTKDRRTLRRIALHPGARAPFPLMCILAGHPDHWHACLWEGSVRRFGGIALSLSTRAFEIRIH